MSQILIGTNYVGYDEPCYYLSETNERAPDSKGFRRYQSLTLIRADKKVVFRRDLGPASKFTAAEFQIIGGATDYSTGRLYVEETVGSLLEIANQLRERPAEELERPDPHDLIKEYHDRPEKRRRARKRQSTFGYGRATQRS